MDNNRLQDELMMERKRRSEYEQKYMSVIDHNLDPIITLKSEGSNYFMQIPLSIKRSVIA